MTLSFFLPPGRFLRRPTRGVRVIGVEFGALEVGECLLMASHHPEGLAADGDGPALIWVEFDDLVEVGECCVDFLVEDVVVVELKAVENLLPIHEAQLLTYLKLSGITLGLLINFNVAMLKQGIKRIVNNFQDSASPRLRGEIKFC